MRHISMYMYVCVCVCVCVYIYIYIHTNIHIGVGGSIIGGDTGGAVYWVTYLGAGIPLGLIAVGSLALNIHLCRFI